MNGETELRNYTGHPLTITVGNKSIRLKSLGRARIDSGVEEKDSIEVEGLKVPLLLLQERRIINLPDPVEGVMYVVSGIVATAAQRDDVVAPSRVLRESKGRVTECRALIIPSPMKRGGD